MLYSACRRRWHRQIEISNKYALTSYVISLSVSTKYLSRNLVSYTILFSHLLFPTGWKLFIQVLETAVSLRLIVHVTINTRLMCVFISYDFKKKLDLIQYLHHSIISKLIYLYFTNPWSSLAMPIVLFGASNVPRYPLTKSCSRQAGVCSLFPACQFEHLERNWKI